jgi:hypothetical protein
LAQRNGAEPADLYALRNELAEAIAAGGASCNRDETVDAENGVLALQHENVLDVRSAAEILSCPADSVRAMCRGGRLAARRVNGRWFPFADAVHELRARKDSDG